MEFRGNDPFATILAFSLLGSSTRGNEHFLSLPKNNLDDEEIWFVAPLSMIQLREATSEKPWLVIAFAWKPDPSFLLLRSDNNCFNWAFEIPTTSCPSSLEKSLDTWLVACLLLLLKRLGPEPYLAFGWPVEYPCTS